jgi:hypothetical protein
MSNAIVYVNDGGTWRPVVSGVSINDGGTWRVAQNVYYNDGGTWREVSRVYQKQMDPSDTRAGVAATAMITWNNSGQMIESDSTGTVETNNWLFPAGTAPTLAEYYIRHTLVSGTSPNVNPSFGNSGALSSGTNRFVQLSQSSIGTLTCVVKTEIAVDSGFTEMVSVVTNTYTATRSS